MSKSIGIETRKNPTNSEDGQKRDTQFPSTRYQGCKRQIIDELWDIISDIEHDSLLDLFGGTGVVSYKAKSAGKRVLYNDVLSFNGRVGKALIENSKIRLTPQDVDNLLTFDLDSYPSFIEDEFEGIYFTDEENRWLDRMRKNITVKLDNRYKKAIAFAAVGQACLTKRPYALFHRANLYMRQNDVERSFGNKTTWERPFEHYFRKFVIEYNRGIFNNYRENRAFSRDATSWDYPQTDLVYLDPPYYAKDKSNPVSDYHLYYHFLEGYIKYAEWPSMIDRSVKTKKIEYDRSPWNDPDLIYDVFERIFRECSDRKIVLSYNTESAPTPDEIQTLLSKYKEQVKVVDIQHKYSLNASDSIQELVFVGYD
ncbi:DNA adenine methylase [Halobacterium noricense]|uniref:DNA adenine methylase n=1 Tax=Halobacterium noricense TaxID=223182 RepID=UPI001E5222B5|nr:DNA adenine methylase [Halobacterium noricense]UHH25670.1 DNA adenine methylase [Halobacterium noricense]